MFGIIEFPTDLYENTSQFNNGIFQVLKTMGVDVTEQTVADALESYRKDRFGEWYLEDGFHREYRAEVVYNETPYTIICNHRPHNDYYIVMHINNNMPEEEKSVKLDHVLRKFAHRLAVETHLSRKFPSPFSR